MALSTFITFWAVSFLFVITPGADWAYAIAAGLRNAVLPAVAGLLLGHLTATLVVAAGVGALVARTPMALTALTIVGSVYLFKQGVGLLCKPPIPEAGGGAGASSAWKWLLRGAGVSGLNPKVFLLFLALLPQFTSVSADWPIPVQIIALGLLHIFSCGVVYSLVGFGSNTILRTRPQAARLVSRVSGSAMLLIAMVLLIEANH